MSVSIETIPKKIFTDGYGNNPRLRVDPGSTGFFDGREFRTYFEITVNTVVQVTVPINVILRNTSLAVHDGQIRLESVVGGTPGGSFSTPLPVIPRNNMTEAPVYTPVVTMFAGGTHTDGTVLDILEVKTAGATGQATSVGASADDERGIAANTYYFRFTVTGVTRGIFKASWEERP